MNKHRYRIVFNQTRGMLMVVAESARRQGKAGESGGPGGRTPARRAAFGLSALSLGVLLFTGAISWSTPLQAQIVADRTAPGNRQASVLNTANGVLQVNIQTPSAAGVSRNVFSRFDVPASGAILNNTRTGAQTRLGGLVQGNPWLATGTARVILNEVNTTSPSQLRGYVEVGGDRAEVVIANPAGIVCDGCGFINASRSTLTTGTPIIGNDGLTGFRVQTGSIVVQGAGLDASSSDYTHLIARAVEVNAGIWAQDLRINTGTAEVSADASQANPLAAGSPAPAFALDVAALGGMYANKITLVGSEAGLGMRNAGHLGASAGNVVVTTAGWLENAGQIESSTRLHIAAAGPISNSGTLLAGTDASLSTPDNVTLGGTLIAQGDVSVAATGNTAWIEAGAASSLIAGRRPDGTLGTIGTLQLTAAGQVGAHGYNLAGNQLQVTGSAIDLQGGQLAAPTILLQASTLGIDLSASHITAQDALIGSSPGRLSTARAAISAQSLRLDAHSLDNTSGELLQFGTDEMRLQLPGELTNRGGRIASNATTLRLGASTLDNGNGNIEHAGTGSLEIRSQTLAGSGGQILSNGLLDLHSAGLVLDAATTRAAQLAITADSFSHRDGQLLQTGSGAGQIITTGSLDNQRGQIASNGALTVTAGSLDNRAGDILTSGTQSLTAYLGTNLDNRDGGRLRTGGNLDIQARSLDNSGGELSAGASLGITATRTFTNIAGLAASNGTGQITTGLLDNQHGQITSNGTLTVTAGSLGNRAGDILTSGTQSLTAYLGTNLDNRDGGRLRAGGKLDLQARSLDNSGGELSAGTSLGVTATQTFANVAGLVASTGNLAVTTGALDNTRGNIQSSQASVRIDSGTFDNTRGQLFAATDLTLGAQNVLNPDGNLYAGHALSLALTGTLIHGGTLAAGQDVTVRARGIDASTTSLFAAGLQSDGSLGGSGVLTLGADETLIAHGRNLAAGAATLQAASLDLSASQTTARAVTLQASTGPLDTRRATVSADEALTLSAGGLLDNRQGNLGAARLDVQAHSLDNTGGELLQSGTDEMRLQLPGELTNRGGRIASNATTLRLGASTLDNTGGRIEHAGTGSLEIRSQNLAGSGGQILSNGLLDLHSAGLVLDAATTRAAQLSISADSFSHRDGQLLQTGTGAGQITTRLLDNQHGQISSNGTLIVTAGSLDNRAGDILTSGTQSLTAYLGTNLDNRDGGRLRAGGKLDLQARSVDNSGGELSAGATLGIALSNTLTNTDGFLVGRNGANVQVGSLDNTRGTLAAILGSAGVQVGTTLDNRAGRIGAQQLLTVSAASLDNRAGTLAASSLSIDTGLGRIDNQGGQLVAGGAQDAGQLTLASGFVDNTGGLIQARGRLTLDTRGQALINRETASAGGILGGATMSVRSAALDNSQGYIGSQSDLEIRATTVDNTHGLIASSGGIDLLADTARNQEGRLLGASDLGLALSASFDNTAGLVRAGGRLSLDAPSVINTRTQGDGLGLEGREVRLSIAQLNNLDGALRADSALSVTSGGSIDNTRGLISSLGTLTLTDPAALGRTLAIAHTRGTLLAGTHLSVDALNLGGDGQLLSGGDLAVRLADSFDNRGELRASGNARLDTAGTLTNRATLAAGGTLNLGVSTLDNHDGGEIRAAQIRIDTQNALTNRGLIDADDAVITSPLVDNLGSGRIYGTRLAIAATTLNNLPEAELAPVIAARERLDLGVSTLENRDHALIFSAGDMAIGASLDARHLASGQAEHLTNASATIEALGQLTLAARRTDNLDAHFSTHSVETATESHLEYAFNGSPVHYDESAIKITYRFGDDGVRTLNVLAPDSAGRELKSENFSAFRFTRTVREEQILNADPGRIVAGGNLVLSGDSLINDKSQILAGGTLSAVLGSLSNIAATGLRTTLDVGTVTNYWRHERSGTDSQGSSTAAYLPAPGVESLTLASPLFAQGSSLGGSTPVIPSGVPASLTPTAQGAGRASTGPRNQAIIEVAASLTPTASVDNTGIAVTSSSGSSPTTTPPITLRDASASTSPVTAPAASIVQPAGGTTTSLAAPLGITTLPTDEHPGALPGPAVIDSSVQNTLVRSLAPALTLPDNRLFSVRPEPGARYLVETDPRFTDRRTWLDSSFMLNALSIDSAATQKRLGDGFYEQQRVREQVAQLTGRRFLDGYANDEVQYQDLMRAGLAYAKAWNLIPGVALSAAQMAQLTTDIVWLVDSPVTLADGSVQHVLAPQVYVRVRDGDIDGSGALLSGNSLNLNLGGTLLNSGTLTGRQWVDLSADTLTNLGGRIGGNNVALNAHLDLQNLGGRLEATQALDVSAGRDISVASTTRSSTSEQGSRTQRDRLAGLYVSGGTLTVHAGRDIQFDAAEILNSAPTAAGPAGTTTLAAGRDLKLGTVTESAAQRIVWDGKNQRSEAGTKEIGSVVRTQGDLQLIAGQDMNLRAASLTSKAGVIQTLVGRDLSLVAGQATTQIDEAHQYQAQGFLKRTTVTTRDTLDQTTALATTLSGNTTTVIADRDVRIQGSNVVSSQGTQLSAGRDLIIEAATDTRRETHAYTEKQSGLFSGGGFGITIGTQQQRTDQDTQGGTAAASTIGSTAGDVLLRAGRAYTQTGSDVQTPQGSIDITAQHVDIVAARETQRSQTETHFTQSGLTLALSNPVISAVQTAVQMKDAASRTTDSRMQALAAANSGLAAYNAGTAIKQGQGSRINDQDNQIATGKTNPDKTQETRDATAADQAGGINVSLSLGGSRSQSRVVQNSDSGRGSTVVAGGDIVITATGAGTASDLTVQGSTIKAGNDIRLTADNAIQLLAGKNTADQQSTNSSMSGALGVSVGSNGLGITLSASGARGKADGNDVTYTNSHVEAGRQLILQSGGDTTLRGALAKADQITAQVGGQLAIDSLQDTSTFKSRQHSLGGSATVGAGASASLSASQSKIDSDFASVAEQSGLKAGDGGFQVTVKGNTDLRGGAITSTDKAVQDGKNSFQSGGAITTIDIRNQADYRASSVGINLGTSQANDGQFKPLGNSAGLGRDQGHSNSTTQAAISGIAGNMAARTGDAETGIQKIFDADRVQKDVSAQVLITQTFGAQASKAVGDYAREQTNALKLQAGQTADPPQKQALLDEAAKWDEGGTYRVLAHTAIGGLTGGVGGALGAGTAAYSAEHINTLTSGMPGGVKQALGAAIASGIGAAVSGTAGAAGGFNEDLNNRQLHPDEAKLIHSKAADYAASRHISVERALAELTQQAEQNNDSAWDKRLGSDNPAAQSFLREIGLGKRMVDPMTGQAYQLFTADVAQRDDHAMFAQYSKSNPLVRAELDLAMNRAYLLQDAQFINTKMTGSDMALNDAARDYANMKVQPTSVQWSVLSELRGTRLEVIEQYAGQSRDLQYLPLTTQNAQSRTDLINQMVSLEERDAALLSASKQQILDMGAAGTANPFKQRETFEGMGEALGLAKFSPTGGSTASINGQINLLKGAVDEAKAASALEQAVAQTKIDLNLYRDWPVASDMVQYRITQLAERATKNPSSDTVVLGKYIEGSANSYEQVAKARGATYFEFPGKTWSEAEVQLGVDKMWAVNKQFLNNQITQGRSFMFTADPRTAGTDSFTAKEYNHLLQNGYRLLEEREGAYRAIKK